MELCDYRSIEGRFDRIASIEMFEAVGEAYWPTYFDKVRSLLASRWPGGSPDHHHPGRPVRGLSQAAGLYPAAGVSRRDAAQRDAPGGRDTRAGLKQTDIRRFGQDYARTLAEWGHRYRAQAKAAQAQGFDESFDRMWRYYLAYCEAGFRTARTDVVQIGLEAV